MRLNSQTDPTGSHDASPRLPRGKRRAVVIALSRVRRRSARPGVNDRGTVLLMVLGVLALMAIIAIAYASLGKADRSSSTSIVRNTRLDDQAGQIADYLSGVIRDGLFATYVEPDQRTGAQQGTVRWRGWDYPFTDPFMRSQPNTPNGPLGVNEYRYTPSGSYSTPSPANTLDRRTPGVPFLSASEPEAMRFGAPGFTPTDPNKPYLDKVDWLSISNFAPSGNFVNLVNLRNNFKCPSGFAQTGGGAPYMSDQMSLLNASGQPSLTLAEPRYNGTGNRVNAADPRVPGDWTINQRGAFRLMSDNLPPEDPNHIFNQWCDTDGDGYADARWFELVDVWNQDDPRPVIPNSGRARLFVAARCVDLSGRVNVNTAGDLYRAPEQAKITGPNSEVDVVQFVPGLFPSDVDLLRILRRTDAVLSLTECYDQCPQPTSTNIAGNYSSFGPDPSLRGGLAAYQAIWDFRDAGRVNPSLTGDQVNRVPAPNFVYPDWTDPQNPLPPQGSSMGAAYFPAPSAWDRFQFYARFGGNLDNIHVRRPNPTDANYRFSTGSREVISGFDNADLLELLTFEGINDSSKQSRLEATTIGRSNLTHTPSMRNYDPLRSNRPTTIEKLGRNSGDAPSPTIQEKALLQREVDVRHLLTTLSGDRPLAASPLPGGSDPVNMRNNLRSDVTGVIEALATSGTSNTATALHEAGTRSMFQLYANALMPYTYATLFPNAWDSTVASSRGLSYGGRAELAYLTAAHMAANLAESIDRQANTPEEQAPGAFSVDLTQTAVNQSLNGNPVYTAEFPWPRLNLGDGVNLQRLTDDANLIKSVAQVTNNEARKTIFGIAPQPFIAQVMAINCYVDAPPNAGGDDDVSRNYDPNTNEPLDPITINFGQELSNSDFLFSVLAFQITNPFDVDVQLEPTALDNKSFYYVEYAGRSYRLRAQESSGMSGLKQSVTADLDCARLKPGETRVFYATFPASSDEVDARVNRVKRGLERRLGPGVGAARDFKLEDFARHQFGDGGVNGGVGTREPVHIATIYPETGEAVRNNTALTNPDLHATNSAYEVQATTTPSGTMAAAMPALPSGRAERRVVNLWRVMRQENTATGQDGPTVANDPKNDLLVDRLHDPSDRSTYPDGVLVKSLVDPFGGGNLNQDITGTHAGDDSGSVADARDNTGFAFANFASISRPTNPRTANQQYPKVAVGQIPIWCFETKTDNEIRMTGAPAFSLNDARPAVTTHNAAAFTNGGGRRAHYKKLGDMLTDILGAGNGGAPVRLDEDMQRKVEDKQKNPYDVKDKERIDQIKLAYASTTNNLDPVFDPIRYSKVAPVLYRVAGKVKDADFAGATLNAPVNTTSPAYEYNNRTLYSRVGDFLLPLAIGPSVDPLAIGDDTNFPDIPGPGGNAPENRIKNLEARWTTLSEAMALATDYYTPRDNTNPYYRFARDSRVYAPAAANPDLPKADHGCLTLDAWAPYLHRGNNGVFDPRTDQPLGNGVPLALNILDSVRVGGMPAMYGRPSYYELGHAAPGGFNTLIPGRININTAPLSVLRTLALLSPDLADDVSAQAWRLNQAGLNPTNAADAAKLLARGYNTSTFDYSLPAALWDPNKPRQNWDVAATLVAYRDKIAMLTRNLAGGASQKAEVNFREDRNVPGQARPGGGAPWGRKSATGIDGVHETRGIRTPGEVLAVNIQHTTDTATRAATGGPDRDNSITRLGQDGLATYSPSFDAAVAYDPTSKRTGPNQVPDDYAEKLTIANAILNTITVRTDVFAVWFVIHGYTPEDVAVEDGFPMVPSIARRYVMVVDRSNVTEPGQKPRIVMLKEVPLR